MSDEEAAKGHHEDFDPIADEGLLAAVYPEMRRLAFRLLGPESGGQTLQPSALANEAVLSLMRSSNTSFKTRAEFYSFTARTMRRILVEHARRKIASKRGGGGAGLSLDQVEIGVDPDFTALEVSEALSEFSTVHPRAAAVVEMYFFAGLTIPEIAEVLAISMPTARRDMRFARAWLYGRLRPAR